MLKKSVALASAAVASLCLGAPQGLAADIDPVTGLPLYVSVFGGTSVLKDLEGSLLNYPGFYSILDTEKGYLIGGAVGLQLKDFLRAEMEFSRASNNNAAVLYADSNFILASYSVTGKTKTNYLLANVWLDGNNSSPIKPYVGGGVGLGWGKSDVDFGFGLGPSTQDMDPTLAFQLGAGVNAQLTERVSLDAGYRYKVVPSAKTEFANNVRIESHVVQVGLTLKTSAAANSIALAAPASLASADPVTGVPLYVSVFGGTAAMGEVFGTYIGYPSYSGGLTTEKGYLIGGAVGVRPKDFMRAEIEFSRASMANKEFFTSGYFGAYTYAASGKTKANYLLANLWIDGDNSTPISPYVGGGVGMAWGQSDIDLGFGPNVFDMKSTFAYQLGAGVKLEVNERIDLDVGYRYKVIPNATVGELEGIKAETHSIQGGLTVKF